MELNWIVIGIVAVFIIALIAYLIIRNKKDKDEVTTFFNETEVEPEDEPKLKGNQE